MAEREEIVFAPCSLNWRLSPFVDIGVGVNGADLLRVGLPSIRRKLFMRPWAINSSCIEGILELRVVARRSIENP